MDAFDPLAVCRDLLSTAASISSAIAEALGPLGLDLRDVDLLSMLTRLEGPTQAELGAILKVDRTTMVSVIDRLEGAGLVERRADAADRRVRRIDLTELGQAALPPALESVRRVASAMLPDLSAEQAALVSRLAVRTARPPAVRLRVGKP
jgi:DNA-binding MarR family transcriptional regulator